MELSLESKLEIVDYLKRAGIVSVTRRLFWEGVHRQLSIIGTLPLECDHNMLRSYFYEKLIYEAMRNKLPLSSTDVEFICYPFLRRLYNFQVIVTERSTTASVTPEKLEKHAIFIRYLLSNKVFNRPIWDSIQAMSPSLNGQTYYINLNNPQYKLAIHEKKTLRKFVAGKSTMAVKYNNPRLDRVWRTAKNHRTPGSCAETEIEPSKNCISIASNITSHIECNSTEDQQPQIVKSYCKDDSMILKESLNIDSVASEIVEASPLIGKPCEDDPATLPSTAFQPQISNADYIIELSDDSDQEHTIPYSLYDDTSNESVEN